MFLKCPCACTMLQKIQPSVSKMTMSSEEVSHEYDMLYHCISCLCSGIKERVMPPMAFSSSQCTEFAGLACLIERVRWCL